MTIASYFYINSVRIFCVGSDGCRKGIYLCAAALCISVSASREAWHLRKAVSEINTASAKIKTCYDDDYLNKILKNLLSYDDDKSIVFVDPC